MLKKDRLSGLCRELVLLAARTRVRVVKDLG